MKDKHYNSSVGILIIFLICIPSYEAVSHDDFGEIEITSLWSAAVSNSIYDAESQHKLLQQTEHMPLWENFCSNGRRIEECNDENFKNFQLTRRFSLSGVMEEVLLPLFMSHHEVTRLELTGLTLNAVPYFIHSTTLSSRTWFSEAHSGLMQHELPCLLNALYIRSLPSTFNASVHLQDPRGPGAPFNKDIAIPFHEGSVIIFPSWLTWRYALRVHTTLNEQEIVLGEGITDAGLVALEICAHETEALDTAAKMNNHVSLPVHQP